MKLKTGQVRAIRHVNILINKKRNGNHMDYELYVKKSLHEIAKVRID